MTKSMRKIEESLAKMQTLGSRLSVLFLVLFVLLCAYLVALVALEIFNYAASSAIPDPYVAFQFASSVVIGATYSAMLFVMRGVAKDVARGRSPFTFEHAKRIKIVAWMFVVGVVLNIFISPDFVEMMRIGSVDLGVVSDQVGRYPSIHIDVKSAVGAIVCFSLSSVWKYGALLQADSDDYL